MIDQLFNVLTLLLQTAAVSLSAQLVWILLRRRRTHAEELSARPILIAFFASFVWYFGFFLCGRTLYVIAAPEWRERFFLWGWVAHVPIVSVLVWARQKWHL